MSLLIHFLGFSSPFTSSLPLIILMGLLLHFLSFLGPFTFSLPLLILVGLLAINLVVHTIFVKEESHDHEIV